MALPRYVPHYSVQDYQQWKGDWELWSGIAVARSPAPKKQHQRICAKLHLLLADALKRDGCEDCELYFELDWIVNSDTVYRPDLSIVCGDSDTDFIEKTPDMVVEVLSDSTRQRDLFYKRDSYEQLGVKYYLIVDPSSGDSQLLVLTEKGYEAEEGGTVELPGGLLVDLGFERTRPSRGPRLRRLLRFF